jgi:hypothetical protein
MRRLKHSWLKALNLGSGDISEVACAQHPSPLNPNPPQPIFLRVLRGLCESNYRNPSTLPNPTSNRTIG